ncbi:MAG: DUF2254 domain-containing protein [Sandaracinaceae bacterium]|nr:DUF2254 domain-containing protein [Sandaracinaceae bacterium]
MTEPRTTRAPRSTRPPGLLDLDDVKPTTLKNEYGARSWLVPILVLVGCSLAAFTTFYALDILSTGGPPRPRDHLHPSAVHQFLDFDPTSVTDSVSSLAAMIAAVFGIVVTVVSIIVQLSADRYTGVARMFLRDRINLSVMGYYLVICVCGVWTSFALQSDFVPRAAIVGMMTATTVGLVLMAPYFGYVFWFLEPMNIIARIRNGAITNAKKGVGAARGEFDALQAATLTAMEELTDITSNSISGKDKIIASGAVDALKDFCLAYIANKPHTTTSDAAEQHFWLRIGPSLRLNPDFVAMDPESLADLQLRGTWVEWKVMRQYLGIYNEALASMRDINYLVAIDTRYIGEAASKRDDQELVRLTYRFMNSFLRATLNARDVRTAYNVMNQYRLLVEALLRDGNDELALEGVRHMTYYGHVSFDMKLVFVTETVAYDVSSLCQQAHEHGCDEEGKMLEHFLNLDRPLRSQAQESALLGVRKAQVKLAAYYLSIGEEAKARQIADDMAQEPKARLEQVRSSLETVTSKDFWEIIDRGRNFEYMPPEQRQTLAHFFAWLGVGGDGRESSKA